MEGAPELFDNHKSQEKAKEAQINQLYRHIGQLLEKSLKQNPQTSYIPVVILTARGMKASYPGCV